MAAPLLACIAAVAAFYHVPPGTLAAIQRVEAGRLGMVRSNMDGSQDLGPMQINTRWLRPLAHATRMSPSRLRRALIGDACFNVAVGGAVLRLDLNARKGNLLEAVGDYHSRTPGLHEAYRARVLAVRDKGWGVPPGQRIPRSCRHPHPCPLPPAGQRDRLVPPDPITSP